MRIEKLRTLYIAVCVIAAAVLASVLVWMHGRKAFDAQKWRSASPAERTEMAVRLERSSQLLGFAPEAVESFLGPAGRVQMRFSTVLEGHADLFVYLDSQNRVYYVGARGIPPSVAAQTFDSQRWISLNLNKRLAMAEYLASNKGKDWWGMRRTDVIDRLGQADQEWMTYELQGEDVRSLNVVIVDGRVQHVGVVTAND